MKIKRIIDSQMHEAEFELTYEELAEANAEFIKAFMYNEIITNTYKDIVSDERAKDLAEDAYSRYCDGDGLTEYECITEILDNNNIPH